MKITVGSKNKTKVAAVRDAVALYPNLFPKPEVIGLDVKVDLYGHPKNLDETLKGAIERARQAFVDCSYSFGLEGGLIEVPYTVSGYMEIGACAVYNGKECRLGLAPAFEWPRKVTEMILSGEADASSAFKKLGLTEHEKLGAMDGGIIGMLTNGKVSREDFSKYSILMALIQIEQARMYNESPDEK